MYLSFFNVTIRLEFHLDVISDKLEYLTSENFSDLRRHFIDWYTVALAVFPSLIFMNSMRASSFRQFPTGSPTQLSRAPASKKARAILITPSPFKIVPRPV